MRRLDILDVSGSLLSLFFIYYAITSFVERRSPNLTTGILALGILFALICIAVFSMHNYIDKSYEGCNRKCLFEILMSSILTVPSCYFVSYFLYLKVGQTVGTFLGALCGMYVFSGLKINLPHRTKSILAGVLIGMCSFFVLQDSFLDIQTMGSHSLYPTIAKGEKIYINKAAFGLRVPFLTHYISWWDSPSAGDMIIFQHPKDPLRLWIKRVIAVEGDVIGGEEKRIYLNGKLLKEPYIRHSDRDILLKRDNFGPMTVPKGKLFVMGDNRGASIDSRDFGFVAVETVKGRTF